jgi:chemotaxis-related protein WspD
MNDSVKTVRDCWNVIGVQGDASCPELETWIHCRNCPVYREAASHLLDRPLSEQDLLEATLRVAAVTPTIEQGARSVVIFRLVDEWFSLPTTRFQEVAEERTIHVVPHRKGAVVVGIVNIRGELLPCVSLARLLGVVSPAGGPQQQRPPREGRLLVVHDEQGRVAFLADEIAGVRHVNPQELRPAPATVSTGSTSYTTGVLLWNDTTVGCLDDELVLYSVRKGLA